MGFRHGKDAVFQLGGSDLSAFITNTSFDQNADAHDVTTYGNQSHRKFGGLFDGAVSVDGVYDDGVTGPKAVVEPFIKTIQPFVWRPEGTGAGKPSTTGNVLVQSYVEAGPVADMITFSIAMERDGDWATADQI